MSKCSCISVADLRHRIVIQTLTETADGAGGFTSSWADTVSIWAKITPTSAYERAQAMQLEATVTHKILIRYRSDIVPKQRIKFGSRYFGITGITNIEERNQYLQLMALESPGAAI